MGISQRERGMTLYEVLLVLAVGGTLVVMGFRVYYNLQRDSQVVQVKAQVDMLFDALTHYYQANCANRLDSDGTVRSQGTLAPGSSTPYPPTSNFKPDLTGFLAQSLIPSPLLDTTFGVNGYQVQFIPQSVTPQRVQQGQVSTSACWLVAGTPPTVQCSKTSAKSSLVGPQPIPYSQLIVWQEQVSVKLAANLNAPDYQNILGADCISKDGSTCSTSAVTADAYLIWQRLPSVAANQFSQYSVLEYQSKTFNQQYTQDPFYELYYTGANNAAVPASGTSPSYNLYLCGG